MKYEEPTPITRNDAAADLASGDWQKITMALLRLSLHDPDPVWLEKVLLPYLKHEHPWVRGVAAMCLGHVARLHGVLDTQEVVPAIRALLHDEDRGTRGKAEDALDDIAMFVQRGTDGSDGNPNRE